MRTIFGARLLDTTVKGVLHTVNTTEFSVFFGRPSAAPSFRKPFFPKSPFVRYFFDDLPVLKKSSRIRVPNGIYIYIYIIWVTIYLYGSLRGHRSKCPHGNKAPEVVKEIVLVFVGRTSQAHVGAVLLLVGVCVSFSVVGNTSSCIYQTHRDRTEYLVLVITTAVVRFFLSSVLSCRARLSFVRIVSNSIIVYRYCIELDYRLSVSCRTR